MRPHRRRAHMRALVYAVAAIAAAVGYAVTDDAPAPSVPPPAVEPAPRGDFHGDPDLLRNTLPPGVDRDKALRVLEQAERRAELLPTPRPRPTGGAQNYTLRRDFSGTVYGHAGGTKYGVVIHCTVGSNRPGWGDVTGTADYLERVGLSATFITDFEAHFLQTMPIAGNPYTQGRFFNQYVVSIEIVSTCRETRSQWLASALFKDRALASWLADQLRAIGAPFRRVDPHGCTPPRGYTDHAALECGNDHTDISWKCQRFDPRSWASPPCAFPWDVLARQLADGPDAPNRKLRKWERSHRIAHAMQREGCRRRKDPAGCRAHYRARSAKLHRLIARERRRS